MSNANTASAGLPEEDDLRPPQIDSKELEEIKKERLEELEK